MNPSLISQIQSAGRRLLLPVVCAVVASQAHASGAYAPRDGRVRIGDNLELTVVEDPTFDGCLIVRRGGYLILPAVGRVPVAGLSIRAAEAEVSKALEVSQLAHATVELKKMDNSQVALPAFTPPTLPDFIFVTGRVAHPGGEPFKPGSRLGAYAAIMKAGGLGRAAGRGVYVLRFLPDGTKARIPVDVAAIRANHAPDVALENNDIVVVSQ